MQIYIIGTDEETRAFRSVESARAFVMNYFINNIENWYCDDGCCDSISEAVKLIKEDLDAINSSKPNVPDIVYCDIAELED